jgi:hypothetical protein
MFTPWHHYNRTDVRCKEEINVFSCLLLLLMPDKEEALRLLNEAYERNPGPWKDHSIAVAKCAYAISKRCDDMDISGADLKEICSITVNRLSKQALRLKNQHLLFTSAQVP